jgi:hypothetical protein
MSDLLSLLPAKLRSLPPPIEPAPPSGLEPLVPSFESVPRNVSYFGDAIYRFGAAPGRPVHASEFTIDGAAGFFGMLITTGGTGCRVRELLTREQAYSRIEEAGKPPPHAAWVRTPRTPIPPLLAHFSSGALAAAAAAALTPSPIP